MATKCRHGRKKSGACKSKPGPKRGSRKASRRGACRHGVNKRTGKCLKRPRRK